MSLIQTTGTVTLDSATGTVVVNMPSNFTAGNTAILCLATFLTTPTSITVNGVTKTSPVQQSVAAGSFNIISQIWEFPNVAGGAKNVSITVGTGNFLALACEEWSGMPNPAFDVGAAGTSAATHNPTATTPTLSQANEVVFAVFGDDTGAVSTNTQPVGWTSVFNEGDGGSHQAGAAASLTVAATTAVTATWTITDPGNPQCSACIASFKLSGGSPSGAAIPAAAISYVTA